MITYRPCGACRALVPDDTGCEHWTPGMSPHTLRSKKSRDRMNQELAEARRRRKAVDG